MTRVGDLVTEHGDRFVVDVRRFPVVRMSNVGSFVVALVNGLVFDTSADTRQTSGSASAPGVVARRMQDVPQAELLAQQGTVIVSWVVFKETGNVRMVFDNGWHITVRPRDSVGWTITLHDDVVLTS